MLYSFTKVPSETVSNKPTEEFQKSGKKEKKNQTVLPAICINAIARFDSPAFLIARTNQQGFFVRLM